MLAALLSTLLFSISAICGQRSARQIGGVEANFWRICIAIAFLAIWANLFGTRTNGEALPYFALSGLLGIGLGDTFYFQALTRLGARRTVLISQCLTAPAAALIEWLWLGTKLSGGQMLFIAVILTGIALAMAPGEHLEVPQRVMREGIFLGLMAALGGALGAVLSRKAYAVAFASGSVPDPGTSGYQRVLGGAMIPAVILLVAKWRSAHSHGGVFEPKTLNVSREKWGRIWPWVLGNGLAGQTLGVTAMQWALEKKPTGIVMATIAMTPIVLLPMTRVTDGERIGLRSLAGAMIGVAGVIGLAFWR
ncbi:MAG TPA: DMT family transporter [Verrucomicrobiae bacterium]|jgi:drug/metabolite transporter (DMT)-like permease|nr:DMT family transporter [Verrucomicrobiae bacterium]